MSDLTPEERKRNYEEEKARVSQVYFKSAPAVDSPVLPISRTTKPRAWSANSILPHQPPYERLRGIVRPAFSNL